jgi:hypothetical protein
MTVICSHTDRIDLTELPETMARCEDWSGCYVDRVAFVVATNDRRRG